MYAIAEICQNGHVSTDDISLMHGNREKFCSACGEETITKCPSCSTNIRGYYSVPGVITLSSYNPPSYCFNCGKPFPWVTRKIEAAIELMKIEGKLSPTELDQYRKDVEDLTKNSPGVQVSVSRFKKVMTKVGKEASSATKEIIIDLLSEVAKKALYG